MTTLADLRLKQAYHKPEDDIANEFYLPCLAAALRYDRAVGYFSSAIYALAWPSLRSFVENGGKMRLICSPVLTAQDAEAMEEGYAARELAQRQTLRLEFIKLLSTPGTHKPAKVLATLVAMGVIDIRIAWVGEVAGGKQKRLFHDKVGIFQDAQGDQVAFKGSMNETWPGLALDGNLESVDVYLSWASERERARVEEEVEYFDRLWKNDFPQVTTIALPDVARDELVAASDPEHWKELVSEICLEIEASSNWSPEAAPNGRVPRPHQVAALEAWTERGRRGIMEHATGSGKTFTALCAINDAFRRGEVCLILVPSDLLLKQWLAELRQSFATVDLRLLVCGGGHSDWREGGRLRAWTRASVAEGYRAILATIQTASSSNFLQMCRGGEHLFIVADEVHRLGARKARQVLTLHSGPRLGLSATPRRSGDAEGTSAIFEYFQGVVLPPFTLFDAIQQGTLTPYAYYVHTVRLEADEQDEWTALTAQLRKRMAVALASSASTPEDEQRYKMLLIRRARVVKKARQKVSEAIKVVMGNFHPGQHWIVYCDGYDQLAAVRDGLRDAGCKGVYEYHTAMVGDPGKTLNLFQAQGGVVVAIRCLDEGVDIPAVSHALILASSKNPREFVQRRGRVLRKFTGKWISHIHDVLVTPLFDADEPPSTSMLEGEIVRAIEFGTHAINPGCITDLQRLAIEHQIDWNLMIGAGWEDDADEEP